MNFKFIRSPAEIAKEAVEANDALANPYKAGYRACYDQLCHELRDANSATIIMMQPIMGNLARKVKSL